MVGGAFWAGAHRCSHSRTGNGFRIEFHPHGEPPARVTFAFTGLIKALQHRGRLRRMKAHGIICVDWQDSIRNSRRGSWPGTASALFLSLAPSLLILHGPPTTVWKISSRLQRRVIIWRWDCSQI